MVFEGCVYIIYDCVYIVGVCFAGGAVAGAVSGLGNAAIFGENIGRGIIAGFISGAIGGAVIGGTVGGIQQGLANAKVNTTGIGTKGNIWTGNAVAPGRSVWALNNTPKATTVGKVGRLEVGRLEKISIESPNADGYLKIKELGDGVKIIPKPNEIIQSVKEFNITGKGHLNGNLNVSQSDYNNLLRGYTYNSTPRISTNGITYPFKTPSYNGSFYISSSGGEPTMQIINNVTLFKYKIRFTIHP
ncbi:hypothetical protein [Riemerella columbina]|uniref:hypothetical protein n=1 Tax=Riemerella columbina TaxID=103810 RepID=UPI0026702741|nr:hypothetical protein [Riemerella columbina]WKS95305.1 hypothetical protein NYR17_00775 [Riemerella columbina]